MPRKTGLFSYNYLYTIHLQCILLRCWLHNNFNVHLFELFWIYVPEGMYLEFKVDIVSTAVLVKGISISFIIIFTGRAFGNKSFNLKVSRSSLFKSTEISSSSCLKIPVLNPHIKHFFLYLLILMIL